MSTNETNKPGFLEIAGKVMLRGLLGLLGGAALGFVVGAAMTYFGMHGGKDGWVVGGAVAAFFGGTLGAKVAFQTFKLN